MSNQWMVEVQSILNDFLHFSSVDYCMFMYPSRDLYIFPVGLPETTDRQVADILSGDVQHLGKLMNDLAASSIRWPIELVGIKFQSTDVFVVIYALYNDAYILMYFSKTASLGIWQLTFMSKLKKLAQILSDNMV